MNQNVTVIEKVKAKQGLHMLSMISRPANLSYSKA